MVPGRNPANADISAETGIPKNSDLVFEDTPEGSEHSGTESPEHAPAQVPKQHPSRLPHSSWQEHSAGGPNLAPEPEVGPAEPFPAVINSAAHPWHQHVHFLNVQNAQRTWETLRATQPCLQLPDKQPPALEDDFQQLFVQLVFQHMSRVFAGEPVAPLRLLLLGTAGTGKTFAVQTLLQLLHTRLQELHLPQSTVCGSLLRYNDEAVRFLRILHRLRDCPGLWKTTTGSANVSAVRLAWASVLRFKHAPVLMDFRRTTETNPEHNCDFFNRMRLRRLAQETQTSVARFVAVHGGNARVCGWIPACSAD